MPTSRTAGLRIDHISLAVEHFSDAVATLAKLAGLETTVSAEKPDQHGRVFLDRSYIEVSTELDAAPWSAPLFFLRFTGPAGLRTHLESAGIEFSWGDYVGVDGVWDDVEITAGDMPLPILVRRTSPPEIAADWPPAFTGPHPSGAISLRSIMVTVPDRRAAQGAYARLMGETANRILLEEGDDIGVSGIVLGVRSMETARAYLGSSLGMMDATGVSWLDWEMDSRFRLGFAVA